MYIIWFSNGLSQKLQYLKKNDMFSSISTSVDVSNLKSLEATYNKNQEISSSSVEHSLTDGSTQKTVVSLLTFPFLFLHVYIWDKVFKSGLRKFCEGDSL